MAPSPETMSSSYPDDDNPTDIREIHALTSSSPTPPTRTPSSTLSLDSVNFSSMSREFNALVVAGAASSSIDHQQQHHPDTQTDTDTGNNLSRIREDELLLLEDSNPLAIVPDNSSNPVRSPRRDPVPAVVVAGNRRAAAEAAPSVSSVHEVKKEETETKIAAWQTAEIAKVNNRFKREDVVINGWESEKLEKATAWLKKVERKLEEERARAMEKMENEVAKARRKAEEKRASAEAKRGMKVAKVMEVGNLLRAVGRAPSKRSFFF